MTYKTAPVGVRIVETGELVTPGAKGWDVYLAWLAAGNTPLPADADPGPTVADRRANRQLRATQAREAAMRKDFMQVSTGIRWQFDDRDRQLLISACAVIAAGGNVGTVTMRDADGVRHVLTEADVRALARRWVDVQQARLIRLWDLQDAIAAAADPDQIDTSTGW